MIYGPRFCYWLGTKAAFGGDGRTFRKRPSPDYATGFVGNCKPTKHRGVPAAAAFFFGDDFLAWIFIFSSACCSSADLVLLADGA